MPILNPLRVAYLSSRRLVYNSDLEFVVYLGEDGHDEVAAYREATRVNFPVG
jgi:hypothetical protein